EMLDTCQAASRDGRRKGRGKDEACRKGTYCVHDDAGRCDVTTDYADGLGHGALDDVDLVDQVALGSDASHSSAVHADRMNFVEIGQRVEALGNFHDVGNRCDVAVHRVDRLEHNQLRLTNWIAGQYLGQVFHVIMAKHLPFIRCCSDAVDDRCVIQRIADHDTIGDLPQQALEGGVVRAKAGRENQCRFFIVPVGKTRLESLIKLVGATYVARTA